MPTFTASTPASISARVPSAVATLPAISSKPWKFFRVSRTAVDHALRVAVRGVHDDHVHAGLHQRVDARLAIRGHAHGGGAQQAALGVLGRVGVRAALLDVLDGDQALELELPR